MDFQSCFGVKEIFKIVFVLKRPLGVLSAQMIHKRPRKFIFSVKNLVI